MDKLGFWIRVPLVNVIKSLKHYDRSAVLMQSDFALQRTFGNIWKYFWLSTTGRSGDCYWHLGGKRQEMLLNILQSTRQSSITNNHLTPNIISAKVEKPWNGCSFTTIKNIYIYKVTDSTEGLISWGMNTK